MTAAGSPDYDFESLRALATASPAEFERVRRRLLAATLGNDRQRALQDLVDTGRGQWPSGEVACLALSEALLALATHLQTLSAALCQPAE